MTNPRTDITVGMAVTPWQVRPTAVQLFRFSAVTWNAHRIHYDREYAETEGYPDVLVQSHLHGCFLARAALDWAGEGASLREFRWENRGIAVPGDVLTVTGKVTAIDVQEGESVIELSLEEHTQDGTLCAPARAVLALPRAGGAQ